MTDWAYPDSTLVRVVDGDTFVAQLTRDIGFHAVVSWQQRFRLNRINAAPARTDMGKAATAYLTGLLAAEPFLLDSVGAYKYGDEWMAEVTVATGNVSDLMVAANQALPWSGAGPRPGG